MILSNVPLCFIDTETTELNPHTRAVWEVALIRREPDGSEKRKEFFVELTNRELALASQESLEIGGFDDRYDPLEAFSKRTAAAIIRDFTDGAHLVGMVPDFDAYGFQSIFDAVEGEYSKPGYHYQFIDVDTLAKGVFLAKKGTDDNKVWWPVDTDALTSYLGVEIEEADRHTAMGDADWTMRYYDAVVNYALDK